MGMLVLTRKAGQRIVIDGRIVVSVEEIAEGKVRLGFIADKSVAINREEIQQVIDREQVSGGSGGARGRGRLGGPLR